MKITRIEAESTASDSEKTKAGRRVIWSRWYVQLMVLVFAFAAGALVYRSGIVRPAYLFLHQVITEGPGFIELPAPVREVEASLEDEARMYINNGLPTLFIDMPFESYQALLDKRAEALAIGILNTTDDDFVKSTVYLKDGPKLDARLRLKGDWTDHLEGDKWSFRIHLKEEGQILRKRQFSIQSPDTRNYLYEWAFHKNLIDEGVLTTSYDFVNVILNGKLLGVYALEENFTGDLVESQGRRQGVTIRFNEDLMWQNLTTFWSQGFNQESNFMVTNMDSADIDAFQASKIAEDPTLAAEETAARGLLRAFQTGKLPASEVFDVKLLGRFFALHDLWAACHGTAWHNPRFYYNPVTGLLEPVAYDAEPMVWCGTEQTIIGEFAKNKLFEDPDVRAAYANELNRITRPGYITELKDAIETEHRALEKALKIEFRDVDVAVDWQALEKRSTNLGLELQPAQTVRGSYQILPAVDGAAARLAVDLVNLMLLPVEVDQVEFNGQALPVGPEPVVLRPITNVGEDVFQPVRIILDLPAEPVLDTEIPQVEVVTHLSGIARTFRLTLEGAVMPENLAVGPAPRQPSLDEALRQHPFLSANPQNPAVLRVASGAWDVEGDLILPENTELFVPAGSVLRFSTGSLLYATGAVHLLGSKSAPVVLTAQQDGWGGIVVLKTGAQSRWEYAVVEKTTGISRDGWLMTGGITFFQADVLLDHAVIGNNQTEDAINVIHSSFEFRNTLFTKTFADAFDSDFSNGSVTFCDFQDIAGDAVDVSGTTITISDTSMERIGDKGVSVGEESTAELARVQMDTIGIGVASKDLSTVVVLESKIRKARFSALAAYIKKPQYGPGRIEAPDVLIEETDQPAVVQKGSTILLHGEAVDTVDLDVDLLYQQAILGN